MSIFRSLRSCIFPVSLLIAVSAAPAAAQSSSEKNPVAVLSQEPGQSNSSANPDPHFPNLISPDLLSPSLAAGLNPAQPPDRMRIDQYRLRSNEFATPRVVYGPDGQPLADNVCYTMRSYRVVRDSPRSDTTHAGSYTTCQAATRFRVRSTKEEVPPAR
jgi:hypothetical protein